MPEEKPIQDPVVSSTSERYTSTPSSPVQARPSENSRPIQCPKVTSTVPFYDRNVIVAVERLLGL
jgi:hypothetical protein